MSSVVKMTRVIVASVTKGLSVDLQKLISPAQVVNIELNNMKGI